MLIELARCCICPGKPPITYDDSINLIIKALEEAPYTDGISLLRHIYSLKQDPIREEYWKKILDSKPELISPSIDPEFLINEYLDEKTK